MATVPPLARVKTICSNSCKWVYSSGGWTVSASSCTAGCGCSAKSLLGSKYTLSASGVPTTAVAHVDFLAAATLMLGDPRVPRYPANPVLTATAPAVGVVYEMPCVSD